MSGKTWRGESWMLEPVAAASLVQLFFVATVLGAKGERLSPMMLVPMIVMAGAASAGALTLLQH